MLKTVPIFILFLFVISCAGGLTQIPASEKTIHVSSDIPGQTQQQLLIATRTWMEKYFTTDAEPIVFEDWTDGKITGHGQIAYPCSWPECMTRGDLKVSFSMRIDAQDKLVSTRFYNIEIYSLPSGSGSAYRSGMSVQVWSKHDMDAIRPKLLELNNKLVAFLLENRN